MNESKRLHIFKPGRQVAMSGLALEFSEADLAASARAYDLAKHEAPIVVGHPRNDTPAYGWVKSLACDADGLSAQTHQIDADFAELVAAGRYKKISASFYVPDAPNNPVPGVYYLRHVGFLGAQPPAVKGLKPAEFADAEDGVVEFGDWGMQTDAGLWRRMREWLLAKFGQEVADQVTPDWQIESIREAARQDDDIARAAFADPASTTHQPHEESPAVTPEEKAALEAENAQLKQRLAQAQAQQKTTAATQRHAEHLTYAEQLVSEGRLAPRHKDAVVAFLDFADGESALEFGEGDARQPLIGAFKSFLGDMRQVVEFGESATKGRSGKGGDMHVAEFAEKSTDPGRLNLHVRAAELAAQKGIPYEQAARQLISNGIN
ncbi:peptidase [Verminephrobacter aporrectodeae subsp. tuberculatae]|uniref:peptidase n=1 Tax=Verminephrobacter aporrectodeae TaxID=1110389 RepID=UPI0022383D3F|nr:peptidase [Verminephrobacter aporrectodeae]MCW5223513.1 peptidase [Verminephrobacter aporrectodeae subsp. tuberculatae]MCW5288978.1 peptidase [Verminephrobacter aporrectodeae subsp. tuberculatae]